MTTQGYAGWEISTDVFEESVGDIDATEYVDRLESALADRFPGAEIQVQLKHDGVGYTRVFAPGIDGERLEEADIVREIGEQVWQAMLAETP